MTRPHGSLFSGIGGFDLAFERAGFMSKWVVEKEKFPREVLRVHFPNAAQHNDILKVGGHNLERVHVVTGGFPCQDLSVAGLRKGLGGERSGLFFEFARVVGELLPKWFVCENVPGLFSSSTGKDFDIVVETLSQLGYGLAWRTLDSQFFGVAQRRRRVFIVGCFGDGGSAAKVLFEPEGVCGDHPPSREKGQGFTHDVAPCIAASGRGFERTDDTRGQDAVIAHSLRADGFDALEDGTGRGTPLVPCYGIDEEQNASEEMFGCLKARTEGGGFEGTVAIAFSAKDFGSDATEDLSPTLRAGGHNKSHANAGVMPAVAFGFSAGQSEGAGTIAYRPEMSPTLRGASSGTNQVPALHSGMAVRRLTPKECSRLQAFPDDFLETIYADATKAHTAQILHELWKTVGTFAREGWWSSIAASLLTPEILLAGVYGGWVPWEMAGRCAAARRTLSCSDSWPEGFVSALQINSKCGSSPYRRESFEQLARELGRPVSEVPYERAQAEAALLTSGLWEAAQAEWPLRYAFTKKESGKVLNPDGPRYKALGNAVTVNTVQWIAERIVRVDAK